MSIWLIPQGAEFKAVQQGVALASPSGCPPTLHLIAIPLSGVPSENWLAQVEALPKTESIILLGLAGSLNPRLQVGDVVISQHIRDLQGQCYGNDAEVNAKLRQALPQATQGIALSSDRIITQMTEKQSLGQTLGCDLVEMEAAIVGTLLAQRQLTWSMVRVISDGLSHNLPPIDRAIRPDASLNPLALAQILLQQPINAFHFIQGALTGLEKLTKVSTQLADYELEIPL